jgi:hypothetical protein
LKETHEAQIKALERQNQILSMTSYDRAFAIRDGQKKDFEMERAKLEQRIADLQRGGSKEEVADARRRLAATQYRIDLVDATKRCLEANLARDPLNAGLIAGGTVVDCLSVKPKR